MNVAFGLSSYFFVDIIHQGQQKRVEVPKEEREDPPQLPLQPDAGMVVFESSDGFEQRRAKHAQQGHHNFNLPHQENEITIDSNNSDRLTLSRVRAASSWLGISGGFIKTSGPGHSARSFRSTPAVISKG